MSPITRSRIMSTDALPERNLRSQSNSGQQSARLKLEAQDDANGPAAQPSSPATQVPASNPSHKENDPTLQASVIQHSLTGYRIDPEYSDLIIVCGDYEYMVHRIIVCSESVVIKAMSSDLERDQYLTLDQYDSETMFRVLSFCYRRTYNDGEFPFTVAPFLISMTADDVHDALKTPLAVASDVQDRALCLECEAPNDAKEQQQQDEYVPPSGDAQCPVEYDYESSDDDDYESESEDWNIPSEPQNPTGIPEPPYTISLLANFKVYVAAQELQIPALQLVARERFAHSLRAHWGRFADFPALVDLVYSRTDESDPLRALICQVVAVGYECKTKRNSKNEMIANAEVAFRDEIRELMTKNGEFAAEVLDATLRVKSDWEDMQGVIYAEDIS